MDKKITHNNYFTINEKIIEALKNIKRDIHLSMNGVVADSMKEHGMSYKDNHGVSWPRLKELSSRYEPGIELANMLWYSESREQMLLATLLMPEQGLTLKQVNDWVDTIPTFEVADALASLLAKSDSVKINPQWPEQSEIKHYLTIQILNHRAERLTYNDVREVMHELEKWHNSESKNVVNAELNLLLKLINKKEETLALIEEFALKLEDKKSKSDAYLKNFILEEINYRKNQAS